MRASRGDFTQLHSDKLTRLNVDQKTFVLQRVRGKPCQGRQLVQISRKAKRDAPDLSPFVGLPLNFLEICRGFVADVGRPLFRDLNSLFGIYRGVATSSIVRELR
jgi:hypothetical protein